MRGPLCVILQKQPSKIEMKMKKIFKVLALLNFIGLLTLFLFFRRGSFDNYIQNGKENSLTSSNGGTPTKVLKDTSIQKIDSLQRRRLSSSKSLVIIDNLKLDKDTSKITKDSITIELTEEEKRLMYSSKSGIIIDPKMFKVDSVKFNSKNKKKKKN